MYDHNTLFNLVKAHVKTTMNKDIYDADTAGTKRSYSEEEAKIAARELVKDLELAFMAIQKHKGFQTEYIIPREKVTYTVKRDGTTGFRIHVNFPAKYLFRPSLMRVGSRSEGYVSHQRTGEGIHDIFALFTTGYITGKKMPTGYWYSKTRWGDEPGENYRSTVVKAPNYFPSSSFISDTISLFERNHPGIVVEYPEEWH